MKFSSLFPITLLCLAAPAAFGQQATQRIAVANPGRVFQEMKETQELKVNLESEGNRLKAEEDERRSEVQKLQNKRDQLKNDTPQWEELNSKFTDAYGDFQAWGAKTKAKAERSQKKQMVLLFQHIEQAINEVAKREGFDLVISDQHPEINNLDQVNFDQLRAVLTARTVLFSSPKTDITDSVIQQANATFKSKGGTGATAPPPAPTKDAAKDAAKKPPAAAPK